MHRVTISVFEPSRSPNRSLGSWGKTLVEVAFLELKVVHRVKPTFGRNEIGYIGRGSYVKVRFDMSHFAR